MVLKDEMYSVVIPTHNSALTILESVSSVLNQTLPPYEIIVIDDCSIDETVQLINSLNLPNLKLIQNDSNRGASFCRNLGVKISKSEWVAFLDSDDIWHTNKMENQIAAASHFNADFISCGFQTHEGLDNIVIDRYLAKYKIKRIGFVKLLFKNYISTPSVLLNKRIKFEFNANLRYCEDLDLWLRLSRCYTPIYLDVPLVSVYRPRLHLGLSAKIFKMEFAEIRVIFMHFKFNPVLVSFAILFSILKFIKRFLLRYMILSFNRLVNLVIVPLRGKIEN